ncbi:sugar ABC transporter ATP-binding protein [Verminephrobacter eiseniae]|uniref:ABC transporter related n=1 Tax=Verminephrobacter eiseniae (strain EF01-2) TaxID=391735 RepID=A1WMZ7_VEREI|nr:sugar ABC transporter ATP-binding protein [Verminephrobacter eiseniae]ABM59004.1 ABC transporter related [Verminephrobacter eiseniae EF01-2]MCW5284560.1 sugar ABC transporter ATP-binding protein [Verminephrobacter eiseniae]MCW5302266.1 sugar ABC transporter ATP-binding protein [Verminephrobacter eiseniae]MCW8179870.1 sugar ABC transporter ATP-binding protein [Verminephrobacter eiseniae]MCW8189919.1 sugar ABC transporter ATP-binding protein [Verminephrobacter eiseniae]
MSVAVEFRDVVKAFGTVQVLHGVSLALQPGRVYGLLGENGAGKSTLMKILAGYENPTSGQVLVDGVVRPPAGFGPRAAEAQGIVLIHQEFNLADDLTIAQNVFLGHELRRGLFLDERAMREQTSQALAQVGLNLAPQRRVRQLIVAEKQLVEIARALARNARLLIMDEPSATLTSGETERLFALMAALKAAGVTIIYISHKLDEVERNTDEVLVMRDGLLVARAPTASVTRQQMAQLMVGRELADLFPPKLPAPVGEAMLKVRDLTVPGWAQNISFEVRRGEILGFAGLVGAGRTELFEGLLGLRARSSGTVELAGSLRQIDSPRDAARHGLTYLSEDRKGKGLHVHLGLRPNLTLMALQRYARPWLKPAAEQAALRQAVDEFGIRTGALDLRASSLSGGNQQKLALAKVLHPGPGVVVLDEPTRGVDVGAKCEIYYLVQRLAAQGLAVIVISSELLELIGLCHRVAVLRAGQLQTTLQGPDLTEEELIAHATGTR